LKTFNMADQPPNINKQNLIKIKKT
jgi:hypothetical protein